ncbi:MAG: chromosomal replication initiator protein DnaA [Eubacterium sp.]|nr:chromosomal replication initiator protein DnaA [Eubacterium sp.]
MDTYKDIWEAVLSYCKNKDSAVSATGYNLWLSDADITDFKNNTVFLHLSSPLKKKIVMEQYGNLLTEAFEAVMGFKIDIFYDCDSSSPTIFDNANISDEAEEKDSDDSSDQFTFDTFIEGPSNKFAYRAAIAVADNPGGTMKKDSIFSNYNPLFIYGKSGLGKTHILNAICCQIHKNYPAMHILYVRAEDFTNEFINALGKKTVDEFHDKFRNIDVLLVDDIQFIGGKQSTEEEFFHTFNSLVEKGKQVVLTSDRPPKEIQSLTERLCSRFENGLLADIQSPEYETRCAIIKRKAELLNFEIPDTVVSYIAEKIKTNIRQLEGTTKKLYAMNKIGGNLPTIALAQKVIQDVTTDDIEPLPVTIQRIVEEVSRTEGVSVEDIYSNKHRANIVHARRIALYIIREVTNISYEMIGENFNKHHSTVLYNIEQLTNDMNNDSRLKRKVNDIINNIKAE